jgi:excisionase family DNA binding protein
MAVYVTLWQQNNEGLLPSLQVLKIQKMSTNIRVSRNCEYCGEAFEAKTLVTRYCSHTCNRRHYKQRKKEEKLQQYKAQAKKPKIKLPHPDLNFEQLGRKTYLSIKESAAFIGISERTLYRLLKSGQLPSKKLGARTFILRQDIDKLFKD